MKLAHANTTLLGAILLVCGYIVVMPLVPILTFWFESHTTSRLQMLGSELHVPLSKESAMPEGNRLVIPAMLLDAPINEGQTMAALHSGTWRRPNTSTPDKGSNTVIVAHRFTYTDPRGPFYFLNNMQVGDEIGIFWQGKRYIYKVNATNVVHPDQASIENPTSDARLTLYTCTPLWLPKDRLVVTAELERG